MRNISYMLNSLNFFVFLVFSYKSGSDARTTNIFSPVTCEMFYFLFVCKSIVISGKKKLLILSLPTFSLFPPIFSSWATFLSHQWAKKKTPHHSPTISYTPP